MKPASTDWKEEITADEEQRFAGYVEKFRAIQEKNSKLFGKGRILHRKQLLGLKAEFEVLSQIPEHAKQGIFRKPGKFESWIRLSNGSMQIQSDSKGDIRGFAIKVKGVEGPGALQSGNVKAQDFLLINLEAFSSPKSEEFVGLVTAVADGGLSLLKYLVGRYGFFGALSKIRKTAAAFNKPFSGFATEKFYSAAPISWGPYAGRVRLVPSQNRSGSNGSSSDWGNDMKLHLEQGSLSYDFQVQFFVSENVTPIEDASVNWPESEAPYVTVAKLTIPAQDWNSPSWEEFQKNVEQAIFDPWEALLEHKPLGDVMRARKHVYFASQKGRNAVQ